MAATLMIAHQNGDLLNQDHLGSGRGPGRLHRRQLFAIKIAPRARAPTGQLNAVGRFLLRALLCALCHRSIESDNPCLTCTAHVLEDNCLWGNVSLQTPSALPSHETRHTADDTEHSANSDAAVTETICRTSFEVQKAGDTPGSVIVSVTDFSSHAAGAWPHVADGDGMLSLHKPQGPSARKLPKGENRPLLCLATTANHPHPQNALWLPLCNATSAPKVDSQLANCIGCSAPIRTMSATPDSNQSRRSVPKSRRAGHSSLRFVNHSVDFGF
ncbi:hypothetical protein K456DRAFT_1907620 [Colletotrichum gloeosporioides 23]|nr:hypothetical protein K456DRAFT_1907620 [Colletotrichum gloeosporioides 23]